MCWMQISSDFDVLGSDKMCNAYQFSKSELLNCVCSIMDKHSTFAKKVLQINWSAT